MPKKSGPEKSGEYKKKLDSDRLRAFVEKLSVYGYTMTDMLRRIRGKFGKSVPENTVLYHLRKIREAQLETLEEERKEQVAQKLSELRFLRRKAYAAYNRTLRPLAKQAVVNGEVVSLVVERDPQVAFLNHILTLLQTEMDLMGLEAPKQQEVKATVQTLDWNTFLAVPAAQQTVDPVEEALRAAREMPVIGPVKSPELESNKGVE